MVSATCANDMVTPILFVLTMLSHLRVRQLLSVSRPCFWIHYFKCQGNVTVRREPTLPLGHMKYHFCPVAPYIRAQVVKIAPV